MLSVSPEVADALSADRAVVALESTIVSHGLPRPDNARIAREIEQAVRDGGAVPATIALVDGVVRVGLDDAALEAIASRDDVVKCSARDLPIAAARGATGATTVASTAHVAAQAGIGLFATGGLGGVHRQAQETWDESADLVALSRTGICVVCAGVKSILDIPATLERLETLGIAVAGYRTSRFPAFYLVDSGHELPWRLDAPEEVAAVLDARAGLGLDRSALVIAKPIAPEEELDRELHERVLNDALAAAEAEGVAGRDVTPFLLARFHEQTAGESLRANVALVLANARLAAEIAVAHAARR
jgi:pseudouridine-5'-phosphate glycosidase